MIPTKIKLCISLFYLSAVSYSPLHIQFLQICYFPYVDILEIRDFTQRVQEEKNRLDFENGVRMELENWMEMCVLPAVANIWFLFTLR